MKRDRALFFVALAAWALVAARLLASGFRDDDWTFLAHVRSAASWLDLVTPSGHFAFYRPAALVLFRIEHAIFGFNAAGYLLVNALLHAANAALGVRVLVYLGASPRAASMAAVLFLLGVGHLGKQVGWACASGPLASVTACLAAMAATGALLRGASGARSLPVLGAGLVLAPLFHESGVLVPLLVGVVLVAGGLAGRVPDRRLQAIAWLGLGASCSWIGLLVSVRAAYPAYPDALESVTRAPWLGLRYLGLLLFPVQPQQWAGAPVVHACLGALLGAAGLACVARWRLPFERRSSVLWGWMFVTLAPYCLVPMPGLWLEPRYVYFAALPACGLLVVGHEMLGRRFALRKLLLHAAVVLVAAGVLATIALQVAYDVRRQALARAGESRGLAHMAGSEHAWRSSR